MENISIKLRHLRLQKGLTFKCLGKEIDVISDKDKRWVYAFPNKAFDNLDIPMVRVPASVPLSPAIEGFIVPNAEKIVNAVMYMT